ncbi:SbcC/MukB-like Walker B domain-containing protein, partial [Aquipuribacter hungaricus]
AHDDARSRAGLLADLASAVGACAQVQERSPAVGAQRAELGAAERAADVAALSEQHDRALGREAGARSTARAALVAAVQHGLVPAEQPHVLAAPAPGGLLDDGHVPGVGDEGTATTLAVVVTTVTALEQDAARRRGSVDALGRDVRRWEQEQADLVAARARLATAGSDLERAREQAAALPARVKDAEARLRGAEAAAADLDGAGREVRRWSGLVADLGRLEQQQQAATRAEVAHLAARAAARAAEQHHDDLRAARLAGMSGELARGLVPGEPCTVCGATEHPAPAPEHGSGVDAEQEEAARAAAAVASEAVTAAAGVLARATEAREGSIARLRADAAPEVSLPGDPPVALTDAGLVMVRQALRARSAAAVDRLALAQAAVGLAEATGAELAGLQAEQARAGDVVVRAEHEQAVAAAAVDAGETRTARSHEHLVEALDDDLLTRTPGEVWRARLAAADEHVVLLGAAASALVALLAAGAEAARAGEAVAACADEAGWPSVAEALVAARSATWVAAARREVTRHDTALHTAEEKVRHLLAAVGGLDAGDALDPLDPLDPAADLDATALLPPVAALHERAAERLEDLRAALAVAEQAGREADTAAHGAATVRDGLRRHVPRLVRAEEATGPLRAEAEATRALAELCGGANDRGTALSTYVLAAHLQHVVEAANLRLHGMSDGRYALVHVEEGEDRRRRAGLGLAVLDAWTGRRRPAGTLSGGETFLASLALALGLADVVTAEAGGARIDALFVDEGFGTLDPESLDRAMDVLDELQEHGRMVGVVSHVSELQQRLPRQVHVEPGRTGSTVRVLTG